MRSATRFTGAVLLAVSALAGCEDEPKINQAPPPAPQPVASAAADGGGAPAELGEDIKPSAFVESDNNRDPFRSSLLTEHTTTVLVRNERAVKLAQYSVDELKLQGVILAGDKRRALFIDPRHVGHVLYERDFFGRQEVVHTGGANGTDYALNWRIDRIREAEFNCPDDGTDPSPLGGARRRICTRFEVNIIREDPPNTATPPARRTLLVHPELADKPG